MRLAEGGCPRCFIEAKPCARHCDPDACPDPAHRPEPQLCEWFALCDRPATGELPHPVLGQVPVCDRCRARAEES